MSVMSSDRKSRSSNSTESTLEKNKLTSLTPFRSAAREVIVPLQHRNVLSLQMAVFFIALYIKQQSTILYKSTFSLQPPGTCGHVCMFLIVFCAF